MFLFHSLEIVQTIGCPRKTPHTDSQNFAAILALPIRTFDISVGIGTFVIGLTQI